MRTVTVIKRMKRRRSGGRSRKFVKKVFSSSTTMFVSSSLWSQMNSDVFQTRMLTAVLCFRSPGTERLRGGEARRAGGDAGRSRVAAGHEQLSVCSAGTSVRPPTDRKSLGVPAACVSLTCPLCPAGLVCRTSLCSTVTEELARLDSLQRIFITIWPRSSRVVSLKRQSV